MKEFNRYNTIYYIWAKDNNPKGTDVAHVQECCPFRSKNYEGTFIICGIGDLGVLKLNLSLYYFCLIFIDIFRPLHLSILRGGVQAFQFWKHDFDLWVGGDGLDMYQQL